MALTRDEQETTVNFLPKDEIRIYSAYPPHMRRLLEKVDEGKATLIQSDEESVTVSVPEGRYDPIRGFKGTRIMSDEQKQQVAERFRAAREAAM